ncbi:DNA-binding transcriptional ArsR family regulator [Bradyrhizobium sp. JR6.1]
MERAADQATELLKALSNRHRLLIICQLIDGERSVGELAEFLSLRDSTVSQHLALLRKGWSGVRPPGGADDLLFDRKRAGA